MRGDNTGNIDPGQGSCMQLGKIIYRSILHKSDSRVVSTSLPLIYKHMNISYPHQILACTNNRGGFRKERKKKGGGKEGGGGGVEVEGSPALL